jgi:hypothetical protein
MNKSNQTVKTTKSTQTAKNPKAVKAPKVVVAPLQYGRGALFALGGPVVGIILWVILWHAGFIASIATFALAWLTVWLYKQGAGGIDRKSLYVILPYIAVGFLLSIVAGMVYDLLRIAFEESADARDMGTWGLLTDSSFWSYIWGNLTYGVFLKEYTTDILISLALGGLGVYGTVRDVLAHGRINNEETSNE